MLKMFGRMPCSAPLIAWDALREVHMHLFISYYGIVLISTQEQHTLQHNCNTDNGKSTGEVRVS